MSSQNVPQWTDLDGGLRVVSDPMPAARATSFGIFVGVGSRDEPSSLAGATHFLEHLTFRGTANNTGPELAEAFDRHGGDCNAYTTRESTVFHARVPKRVWKRAFSVLADVVEVPLLSGDDLEMERQIILEEYNASQDQPEDIAHELLYRSVFGSDGLGRDVLGSAESIAALSVGDLRTWFEKQYCRDRIVVAAAGAVDHDELVAAVEQRWSDRGQGSNYERSNKWRDRTRARLYRDSEQTQIMLAFEGLSYGDDRRFAVAVGNQVLGGGLSSRLFQRIREKRGLAYTVYSGGVSFADTGMLVVGGATMPQRLEELETALKDEVASFVSDGISENELEIAKDAIAGSFELSYDDVGSRMSQLGSSVLYSGRLPDADRDIRRVMELTVADVREVFENLLGAEHTTVVVGPSVE